MFDTPTQIQGARKIRQFVDYHDGASQTWKIHIRNETGGLGFIIHELLEDFARMGRYSIKLHDM